VAHVTDPASAMCAKLTTNMSHQQWRDWVSPDIDYIEACPGLPIRVLLRGIHDDFDGCGRIFRML
jgi:hypothetical protein